MIFLILLLASSIVLALCRNRITLLFWIVLTMVSALRYQVGTDYPNYVDLFNDINAGFQSYLHMEPFHFFINKLSDSLGFGYQFVFFVYALLTNFIFALFFFRLSDFATDYNKKVIFALCTLLYLGNYYFLSLNSIRSCLAAAVYALSLSYYLKNRKLAMIVMMLLGGIIHFSLIPIAITTVLMLRFIFPVKSKTFYIFAGMILLNPINILSYIFVTYKLTYYNYFISERYAVPATILGQVSAYGSVILSLIFYMVFKKNIKIEDKRLLGLFQFSTLSMIAFKIFSVDFFVLARISRYFSPIMYFFISYYVCYYINNKVDIKMKPLILMSAIMLIILSNIIIFYPRGMGDLSYGNYSINPCIFEKDVCDIKISTLK